MEYIISTRNFKNATQFGEMYFDGLFSIENEKLSILEGDIINYNEDELINLAAVDFDALNIIGSYNFVSYNKESQDVFIKNDKFGTYALFIYKKDDTIVISNNVWKIIKILKDDEIIISKKYFKFYIGSWGVDLNGGTLFENITELNPGYVININLKSKELNTKEYFSLEHNKTTTMSITDCVNQFDNDLDLTFSRIKKIQGDKKVSFGNSGGLDSRLVPIYASQNNLNYSGLTILNKRPNKIFESITYRNSKKISAIYNFHNTFINYKFDNTNDRMLLDIRNNPFGTAEVLKNPYDKTPDIDCYVTGGNGFIVGGNWSKILSIKDEKKFINHFVNYNAKIPAFNWTPKGNSILNELLTNEDIKAINDYKIEFYENNKHKDFFSIIRTFHQFSLNKCSPAGGFESINRCYKTYNIYYPIVFENTLKWNPEFFPSRIILKELIKKKSQRLYKIPEQNYSRLDDKKLTIAEKIERRLVLKYRNWGLNYEDWVNQHSFKTYSNEVLNRENEQFYNLLGMKKQKFIALKIMENIHPSVALDVLKLKKILDIITYKEYDFVDYKSFEIK